MKVIEISVEVGRTATINYQSARNSVSLKATLTDSSLSVPAAVRSLQKQAVDMLLGDNEQFRTEEDDITSVDVERFADEIIAGAKARE